MEEHRKTSGVEQDQFDDARVWHTEDVMENKMKIKNSEENEIQKMKQKVMEKENNIKEEQIILRCTLVIRNFFVETKIVLFIRSSVDPI